MSVGADEQPDKPLSAASAFKRTERDSLLQPTARTQVLPTQSDASGLAFGMSTRPAADPFSPDEYLPDDLPESPMAIARAWYDEAHAQKVQPNPNAMTLATIDADGRPSARIVLAKSFEVDPGAVVFYTNYESRKGEALGAHPRAAVVFHWDTMCKQIRLEGPVTRVSEAESDAYFQSRHWSKRVGAWASDQSRPIGSRSAMMEQLAERMIGLGVPMEGLADEGAEVQLDVPRPAHWGGYRLWIEWAELWIQSDARVHDRARWTRELTTAGDRFDLGPWSATRLQP